MVEISIVCKDLPYLMPYLMPTCSKKRRIILSVKTYTTARTKLIVCRFRDDSLWHCRINCQLHVKLNFAIVISLGVWKMIYKWIFELSARKSLIFFFLCLQTAKNSTSGSGYYVGGSSTLPRGGSLLRAYSPAASSVGGPNATPTQPKTLTTPGIRMPMFSSSFLFLYIHLYVIALCMDTVITDCSQSTNSHARGHQWAAQ